MNGVEFNPVVHGAAVVPVAVVLTTACSLVEAWEKQGKVDVFPRGRRSGEAVYRASSTVVARREFRERVPRVESFIRLWRPSALVCSAPAKVVPGCLLRHEGVGGFLLELCLFRNVEVEGTLKASIAKKS